MFINGCSTSGFSPYVPSEFIEQFIRGRKASAVIGAEVPVWEALATEVAKTFFDAFLSGKSAVRIADGTTGAAREEQPARARLLALWQRGSEVGSGAIAGVDVNSPLEGASDALRFTRTTVMSEPAAADHLHAF